MADLRPPIVAPPASNDPDVPDDMRWPSGAAAVPLDEQIAVARAEFHRYCQVHEPRTQRERGHGSMHPLVFAREKRVRLAIYHTLLALKREQELQPSGGTAA